MSIKQRSSLPWGSQDPLFYKRGGDDMIVPASYVIEKGSTEVIVYFEGSGDPKDQHTIIGVRIGMLLIGRGTEEDKRLL